MMKRHPELFLRIEGHTDNSGEPEAALRLSAQRAFAVQAALVKAQVESKRLDAVGVGGLQPWPITPPPQGARRIAGSNWYYGGITHTRRARSRR